VHLLLLLIGALLETGGDIGFKLAADRGSTKCLIAGIILYTLGSAAWVAALWKMELGLAVAVFTCLNVAIAVIAGMLLFKDKTSPMTWVGLALAIAAIVILEMSGKE
jgi:quaternary ammonium compound-resistance protein SugE